MLDMDVVIAFESVNRFIWEFDAEHVEQLFDEYGPDIQFHLREAFDQSVFMLDCPTLLFSALFSPGILCQLIGDKSIHMEQRYLLS